MSQTPVVVEIDFDKAMTLPKEEIRSLIAQLEVKLLEAPQMEIPVTHYFSKGVYGREIKIPKGTLIVGKIHKHHVMNCASGSLSVLSIDGVKRIEGSETFVSSPGAKRVIYAHEDSVWTNFIGTDETDPEKIEDEFIARDYSEVKEIENTDVLKLEAK
jgi:hypothetical protein